MSHKLLVFCKSLALNGANRQTYYVVHLELFRPHFKMDHIITNVKIVNARCNVGTLCDNRIVRECLISYGKHNIRMSTAQTLKSNVLVQQLFYNLN